MCATPAAWLETACSNLDSLLIDHANCEKKAASTALNMIYRYVDKPGLMMRLSKVAREELRHFEQVLALMQRRQIDYVHISPGRYAGRLRDSVQTFEPARLTDMLIVAAVVEARSCERFGRLTEVLDDDELREFYASLMASEARHWRLYIDLAEQFSPGDVEARIEHFLEVDRSLIESPDPEFRFHSGVPAMTESESSPDSSHPVRP